MTARGAVTGLVIVGLAIVLLVSWPAVPDDPARSVTIVPSASAVGRFTPHTISSFQDEPPRKMVFTDGELRVASTEAHTDGNHREIWSLNGDHADVDVTLRIERPSSLGGSFKPQPGLALRFEDDGEGAGRALIVDTNIWNEHYDRMIVGFWSWPAPTTSRVAIDQIGDTLAMQERMAIITGVVRSSGVPATDVYTVDAPWQPSAPYGFAVGDPVDVATVADESFSHTAARISAISPDGELISVEHPGAAEPAGFALELGSIKFHYSDRGVDPRAFYPRYFRARLVGRDLQVKSWLVEDPEPGWQFSESVPDEIDLPATGRVGLVANHLHGADRYLAYGTIRIDPVTTR